MKTLLFLIILGAAGWLAINVIREGDVPRAVAAALEVAPPLKLDYEIKPVLLVFGKQAFLIITNTSDKPVHPSGVIITPAGEKGFSVSVPQVIKEHDSLKIDMIIIPKKGDKIEVSCTGFPVPRSLTFVD